MSLNECVLQESVKMTNYYLDNLLKWSTADFSLTLVEMGTAESADVNTIKPFAIVLT